MAELSKPHGMAWTARKPTNGAIARVQPAPGPQFAGRVASGMLGAALNARDGNGARDSRDLIGWEMNARPL